MLWKVPSPTSDPFKNIALLLQFSIEELEKLSQSTTTKEEEKNSCIQELSFRWEKEKEMVQDYTKK